MSSENVKLRVIAVASDPLVRVGLSALLGAEPTCILVGQVPEIVDVQTTRELYQPDVVLWDLGWDPEQALERLSEVEDNSVLPMLALLPDDGLAGATRAAGAHGILLRDAGSSTLVAALEAVAQGLVVIGPELEAGLVGPKGDASRADVVALTPRELEVLGLLAEGLPNKTLAQRLGITEHTVKFHVNAILGKLGAQSRTEALIIASRRGLILL